MQDATPNSDGYTRAVDMWSIGIIAGLLLSGYLLFSSADEDLPGDELARMTPRNRLQVRFNERQRALEANIPEVDEWKVSSKAKSFVRALLKHDEMERMTAEEALHHAWLSNKIYGKSLGDVYYKAVAGYKAGPVGRTLIQKLNGGQETSGRATVLVHEADDGSTPPLLKIARNASIRLAGSSSSGKENGKGPSSTSLATPSMQ